MSNILTMIITYNPDLTAFQDNLRTIYEQSKDILIYDNASDNVGQIELIVWQFPGIVLVKNAVNEGLPINYNRAARYGNAHGFAWLLIFDQDTHIPADFFPIMERYTETEAAIICPRYRDGNLAANNQTGKADESLKGETSEVKYCISSGSMNRVSTILQYGGFDEKMFIDQIDFDYCRNIVRHGEKILRVNSCCIDHFIGVARYVRILGKRWVVYNHSASRKYYFFKNLVYQIRKWKLTRRTDPQANWMQVFKFYFLILFESDRLKKYAAALRGGVRRAENEAGLIPSAVGSGVLMGLENNRS